MIALKFGLMEPEWIMRMITITQQTLLKSLSITIVYDKGNTVRRYRQLPDIRTIPYYAGAVWQSSEARVMGNET